MYWVRSLGNLVLVDYNLFSVVKLHVGTCIFKKRAHSWYYAKLSGILCTCTFHVNASFELITMLTWTNELSAGMSSYTNNIIMK